MAGYAKRAGVCTPAQRGMILFRNFHKLLRIGAADGAYEILRQLLTGDGEHAVVAGILFHKNISLESKMNYMRQRAGIPLRVTPQQGLPRMYKVLIRYDVILWSDRSALLFDSNCCSRYGHHNQISKLTAFKINTEHRVGTHVNCLLNQPCL